MGMDWPGRGETMDIFQGIQGNRPMPLESLYDCSTTLCRAWDWIGLDWIAGWVVVGWDGGREEGWW